MLPSGKYLSQIASVNAMVIDLGKKKSSFGVVKLLFEAIVQKAQNEPSTQLIKATSCVERWNATITAKKLT